ncbi:LamG domain-containing protein [Rhizobium leguminosarum]
MSFLVNSYRYLSAGATLTVDAGTFTLTGVSAAFALKMQAAAGAFTLTGGDAAFARAQKMQATAGTFTLTGNDADLTTGHPDLHAETGAFTLTGNAAALSRALRIAASSGSFALAGNAAALNKTLSLLAGTGSFALTGVSNTFKRALVMAAAQATFTLTRNAATLTYNAASDPNFSSVKLLCGFNGTDGATSSTDESGVGRTLTFVGNAQLDTAQFKFGASSLLLDGTGDYITCADSADWDFGAGQFTAELFVRFASGFGTNEAFLGQWGATVAEQSWFLFLSSGSLLFRLHDSGGTNRDTSVAWTPTVNTWYHLAVDRDASNKVRVYRDGTMVASNTYSQTFQNGTGLFGIGVVPGFAGTFDLNGWVDEVRVTKGVARYASDSGYTVPTAAFPRS